MADKAEVLLQFWQEQRAQARQSEDQRATLSNLTLALAAGALGLVGQWGLQPRSLLLTITMVFLGGYGGLAAAKYYERNGLHIDQAKKLASLLAETTGFENYEAMMAPVRESHLAGHPFISKVRLYALWISLHVGIALIGLALTGAILVS